ncbi:MAG: serine/threonine protein kinase [Myxococcales bacterium]|nr:serine/threonine protein kinase [Myxococcales bacterium]
MSHDDVSKAPDGRPWEQDTVASGEASSLAAMPPPEPPGPGRVERYEGDTLLGAGGMGEIRLMRDQRIGRDVAIKRLHAERSRDEAAIARFLREARVQGRLEHPSIVPVHDLGVDEDGSVYFVMKRIRGRTLSEMLRAHRDGDRETIGGFGRRKLLNAIGQLCLTLDFAHRHGVIHRDIKPANVMLGDFGELYLLDWGLAKVDGSAERTLSLRDAGDPSEAGLTQSGAILGTPGYASPEQVRSADDVGPQADIYAVGAILFEVLANEPLMPTHRSATEQLIATLDGVDGSPAAREPAIPVPPELDRVCVRALALDPAERCESVREIYQAIEDYLDGQRDEELRGRIAESHEEKAEAAAERALSGSEEPVLARQLAMREIGRALALRPESPKALSLMVRLMSEPPAQIPAEVHAELGRRNDDRLRKGFGYGIVNYSAWLALTPVAFWLGVRDWAPVLGTLLLSLAAVIVCAIGSRAPRVTVPMQYALLLAVTGGLAFATRLAGPFMAIPSMLAVNTFSFALTEVRSRRTIFLLISTLPMLLPMILEAAGMIAPSYLYEGGEIRVLPNALELPAEPTFVLLAIASIVPLVMASFWAGRLRDELVLAETRVSLQQWQIRQMLPVQGAGGSDVGAARKAHGGSSPSSAAPQS